MGRPNPTRYQGQQIATNVPKQLIRPMQKAIRQTRMFKVLSTENRLQGDVMTSRIMLEKYPYHFTLRLHSEKRLGYLVQRKVTHCSNPYAVYGRFITVSEMFRFIMRYIQDREL